MRRGKNVIVGIAFFVILIVSAVLLLNKTATKIDWCGKYEGNFVDDSVNYKKFTPSIYIEKSAEDYIITMAFRTTFGKSQDDVVEELFLPVELEQMDEYKYILVFENKLSKETGIEYTLFVELQYDTERTIKFRYAEKEEDLEEQEYYMLHRVAE